MQDGKALQAGTSHMLGQNFAKQFDLKFQAESGGWEYAWNTSWGVTTRMVGALVMTHGDDNGLIMPPKLAPIQVVIVPIFRKEEQRDVVVAKAKEIAARLKEHAVRVHIDARENMSPGAKYYEWERKGVPLRMEIGPRDVEGGQVVLVRRLVEEGQERKMMLPEADAVSGMGALLDSIQQSLLAAALRRREEGSHRGAIDFDTFKERIESQGGFFFAGWCGDAACEERVKEESKATIRVLPDEEFRSAEKPKSCMVCGRDATVEAVWARAY